MKDKSRTHPRYAAVLLGLVLSLLAVGVALAAGNIDPTNKWAWSTNAGWINFAPVPVSGTFTDGAAVYPDHLEGYAWAENVGWIKLGTHTGGGTWTYLNTSNTSYGVNRNTGTGALSGYAWSTTSGWINFAPVPQSGTFTDGVKVDAAGNFTGYAWSENLGWIKFNGIASNSTTYKVATAGPLAVTLAGFDAQQVDGHVLVAWETVSEIDNAGFNLYRTGSVGDRPEPGDLLATVPSQAPGSTQGAAYNYVDAAVEPSQTYWYWLEDVSLSGATTLHGPVSATVQTPTAVGLADFEAAAGSMPSFAGLALAAGLAAAGGLIWRRRRQEAMR